MNEINLYLIENVGYNIKQLGMAFLIVLLISSVIYCLIRYEMRLISLGVLLSIVGILAFYFKDIFIDVICFYILLPSLVIGGLGGLLALPDKIDDIWDIEFFTNKGRKVIKNIKRGVVIIGSAGSGKTESPIYIILKHLAAKSFTGVCYDYKNGELTEIMQPLFGDRLKIISFHFPHIGIRVNPISQKYISDEKDIGELVEVLVQNLGSGEKANFFSENAQALLSGVILKLHLDDVKNHTNYCTLPHVIALILTADFSEEIGSDKQGNIIVEPYAKLKRFLTDDLRVKMQASAFIGGLDSERQTASVFSTLANMLRKLAFAEAFYTLSGDDIDLAVNKYDNDIMISIVNEPKNDNYLSPAIATIIHTITKQMMERERKQSAVLLDEAPTIKLMNMARIPATMRSFGVATIYCMQDLVQGNVQYSKDKIKEIISNLSIQFFGKTNDSDTSTFYEGYFGMIKEKTLSKNFKGTGGFLSSMSGSTTGEREVREVRAIEFHRLKPGEFAFLSDGKGGIVKMNRNKIVKEKTDNNKITPSMIQSNYEKILNDIKYIVK
ncbi:type IV secretory system conjugative DNA transfer family protein [Flavobacterium psychrophilum]|uniref:type IV secretory system conjugative DNA transfer family protein n=1 Tax=Flavobacterium psychrophilum TaxID=96345 RepID=UPI00106AD5B1|nr:type IV secretory system conjugative DNA transfer family protein [Flavobacterium psychrophilum]